MSRGQSQPRNQSVRRVLERCRTKNTVEIIDVDKENTDVVNIGENSHYGCRDSATMRRNGCPSGVINIDDEDGDADDTFRNVDADATSKGFCPESRDSPTSEESETNERLVSRRKKCVPSILKEDMRTCNDAGPSVNRFGLGLSSSESCSESDSTVSDSSGSICSDSDNSDCEIIEDPSGTIREQWERAALRKKLSAKHRIVSDDQASTSESSGYESSIGKKTCSKPGIEEFIEKVCSYYSKEIPAESLPNNVNIGKEDRSFSTPAATELGKSVWERGAKSTELDTNSTSDLTQKGHAHGLKACAHKTQSTYENIPDNLMSGFGKGLRPDSTIPVQTNHFTEEPSFSMKLQCDSVASPETAGSQDKEKSCFGKKYACNHYCCSGGVVLNADGAPCLEEPSACNANLGSETTERNASSEVGSEDIPQGHTGLIFEREKHKESAEYRRAVEEEWAARQRQLQIQAEEVQRLKRKRKAETLRILDMERRQKERLEEIRDSQKKVEETLNLKECLRADVRKELEKMELRYRDMASLLRGLGIHVEGGSFPSPHQVNAAYKQALLRFHPDRVSRSDIHQQVKSEETFKLISRLKEKLLSVM